MGKKPLCKNDGKAAKGKSAPRAGDIGWFKIIRSELGATVKDHNREIPVSWEWSDFESGKFYININFIFYYYIFRLAG